MALFRRALPVDAETPIKVSALNHFFGRGELRKQILHEVSTDIRAGEIVIVSGPSGSGKTTLLTLIGALRSAQQGSVQVLGRELRGARPRVLERVRRQIGFIFQQHNLVASLSATQNVELGLRLKGWSGIKTRRRATRMLKMVGLSDRLHHRPHQLSGGQRQRVAIARALAGAPPILLADEPTASLDKQSGREVVDHMQMLAREQATTILLVTHDNRILDVADRILHLEDGVLSTFTEAVAQNSEFMMGMLRQHQNKQDVERVVATLSEEDFLQMLNDMTAESERFNEVVSLANDSAFQSLLDQALRAFTFKFSALLNAERASLYLLDREHDSLWLRVGQDLEVGTGIQLPMAAGIAGAVATSGLPERIDDAYRDPRFNRTMDERSGFRTRSIMCLPVFAGDGQVCAVAQLLNRRDGAPFDGADQARFEAFVKPLGPLVESWRRGVV